MSITLSVDRSGSLLFDEDCGICVATAAWLAERVAPHRLRLVGLRDVDAGPRIKALVHRRPLAATLHFVRSDDTILTGARAVLAAGRLVPGWRFLAIMFDHRVGHALLEPLYRQIAAHRRRIGRVLGLPEACAFPPTNQGRRLTLATRGVRPAAPRSRRSTGERAF